MTKSETKRKKLLEASKKYKKDIFGKRIKKLIEKIRFEDEYKDIPIEIIDNIQYLLFTWLWRDQENLIESTAYDRLDNIRGDFIHPIKHIEKENCCTTVKPYIKEMARKPVMFISLADSILFASKARNKIKKIEVIKKILFEFEDLNRTIKALLNNREEVYITLDGIAYTEICKIQVSIKNHNQYDAYKIMQGRPVWETIRMLKYEELKLTKKNIKSFREYTLHHPYKKPEESYKDIFPHVATRGKLILTPNHKPGADND